MTVHITSLTPATIIEVPVPGKNRRWPYIYVDFDSASTFYLLEFENVRQCFIFVFFVFLFCFVICFLFCFCFYYIQIHCVYNKNTNINK